MHWLALILFGGLARVIPALIARVLTSAGLGIFVFGSLTLLFNAIRDHITLEMSNFGAAVTALLNLTGTMVGINIVLSAIAIRIAWDATAVTVRKLG